MGFDSNTSFLTVTLSVLILGSRVARYPKIKGRAVDWEKERLIYSVDERPGGHPAPGAFFLHASIPFRIPRHSAPFEASFSR